MKTADQAQNQSHPNQYAPNSPVLSPCQQLDALDEPIDLAIWGAAEISLAQSFDLLAGVFRNSREAIVRDIYKKIKNPRRRMIFGFGLLFANAVDEFVVGDPFWRANAKARAVIPRPVIMPVFRDFVSYEYADARLYMCEALMMEADAIARIARTEEPARAATSALALLAAKLIINRDGPGEPNFDWMAEETELFAIEMIVRWMDAWAESLLRDSKELLKNQKQSNLGRNVNPPVKDL